jgi:integrase
MSVTKRGDHYYLGIRPFGKLVQLRTSARSKTEARQVETVILMAIRANDYGHLDLVSREACIRLFENQGLELPSTLSGEEPVKELTLLEAARIFLRYPSIKNCSMKIRYGQSLTNLVEKLGPEKPVKNIWVPDLRLYQADRVSDGAAPGTVNQELSTLSKLFKVLIELQMVQANPCRILERLKPGHREVYIGHEDFLRIVEACPSWCHPVFWTAYYSGMRRGEILGLTRKQVNLGARIITLRPEHTKEGKSKRVPIHRELVPVLDQCMKIAALGIDRVFLIQDKDGVRPIPYFTLSNPWRRLVPKLGFDPVPHFHDIRHTWRTNARRSGMRLDLEMAIMGHAGRTKGVHEGYGWISNDELIRAVDSMTFDHGETQIWAYR